VLFRLVEAEDLGVELACRPDTTGSRISGRVLSKSCATWSRVQGASGDTYATLL
jgi:hypothetical protein